MRRSWSIRKSKPMARWRPGGEVGTSELDDDEVGEQACAVEAVAEGTAGGKVEG